MKLAASLWIQIARCYGRVLQDVRRIESRYTLAQFDVLAQLLRHPRGITAGRLSRELLVTAGNVTGLLDRLGGLVEKKADPRDRRIVVVRLTPRGRRIARAEAVRHVRRLAPIFAGVDRAMQARLRDDLRNLFDTLERTHA